MKLTSILLSGALVVTLASCDTASTTTDDATVTDTDVVNTDTTGADVNYNVKRKVVEKVDTVGATKEYDIEKDVARTQTTVDTLTEEYAREKNIDYEEGDYQVVDEDVESETVTEDLNEDSK